MRNYSKIMLFGLAALYVIVSFGATCPCPPGPNEKLGNFMFKPQSFSVVTQPGSSQPVGEIVELQPQQKGSQVSQADVFQVQNALKARYANKNLLVTTVCQATGIGSIKCTVTYPKQN